MAMYNFRDSTDYSPIGSSLMPESVSIDGLYIEEAIEGYKTLYTSGREGLPLEVNEAVVGTANGSRILSTRYPTRIITIGFQLIASNPQDFRTKFNHLNNLLSVEEADFVFNDEIDKFFTGTPIADIEIEPGSNSVVGEWAIYCADPFKYSLEPIVVEPTLIEDNSAEFVIDYGGTYPAKPVLQAEFAGALEDGSHSEDGDCGFVAFMDADENIIQIGNPEAVDLDDYLKAHTPISRTFTAVSSAWKTTGGTRWKNRALAGSIAVNQAITDPYWNKGKGKTARFAKPSYGTGSSWHGPQYLVNIAAGANFELTAVHRMCISNVAQMGCFELSIYQSGSPNSILAGIVIDKSTSGNYGTVRYIVNGKQEATARIDLSYNNTNFGYCKRTAVTTTQYYNKKKKKWQTTKIGRAKKKVTTNYKYTQSNLNIKITKSGNTVKFKVGNLAEKKIKVDGIANLTGSAFLMYFGRYGTKAAMHTNATNSVKVVQNPSTEFAKISNVFTAGDVVEADCSNATIMIKHVDTEEGHLEPQYGALGNDWESFELSRGVNQIKAVWSDWVNPNYKPTVRIIYNEVYI